MSFYMKRIFGLWNMIFTLEKKTKTVLSLNKLSVTDITITSVF